MDSTLKHIVDITSCSYGCTAEDKLKHLRHVFEGYRDYVVYGSTREDCPYPARSSRAASWGHGRLLARNDHE